MSLTMLPVTPDDSGRSKGVRFRAWLKGLFKKERDEQFTREEQLTMVWLGHLLIGGGVVLILALGFNEKDPGSSLKYFWLLEIAIFALAFITANTSSKAIVSAIKKGVTTINWFEAWMARHGDSTKSRFQATTLLGVYGLQFGSMVALLMATGGPIDSPFAPMALAIAIFTPFIVNKWWTVALIVITTMVFYTIFVSIVGFSEEASHPDPGAYVAVNLFILVLATIMTLKRRDNLSMTIRRTFDASPGQVWKAWTERDEVARWFGRGENGQSAISMDVREGGTWSAAMMRRNGAPGFPWSGTIREVKEPKRLVFTIVGRAGRGEEVVVVELNEKDGKTEMVVTQSDNGRYSGLKDGWSAFFDRMSEHLRPS